MAGRFLRVASLVGILMVAIAGVSAADQSRGDVDFSPIETFPAEFPRFYTPITGTEVTLRFSGEEPVPICLPNTDPDGAILAPGSVLTLFVLADGKDSWGAAGSARVSDDGSEICTDDGVGAVVSGLYVVAIRTSDLESGLTDIVQGLGGATPGEPSNLFCNSVTEFVCTQGCNAAYRTRVSLCATRLLACRVSCRDSNPLVRPTCLARCTNQSSLCLAGALNDRRQCRNDCACD